MTIFENMTPDRDKRPGLDASMRLEVQHILASNQFKKAPTLERLLAFLVNETLNGNGKKLKSYTVAVDGLGRDPQFDTQMDSYPRVQVLRLRKMLEAFYSRHAPLAEMCIYIPAGSYDVRLARPAVAYPELFRPLDDMSLPASRNAVLFPVPADFERLQSDVAEGDLTAALAERNITRRHPIFLLACYRCYCCFRLWRSISRCSARPIRQRMPYRPVDNRSCSYSRQAIRLIPILKGSQTVPMRRSPMVSAVHGSSVFGSTKQTNQPHPSPTIILRFKWARCNRANVRCI